MVSLNKQTFTEIINLLIPRCPDTASSRTLVETALFGCQVLEHIDWSGSVREFTTRLVQCLLAYGACETGQPSLVMLLQELKTQVGVDQASAIDQLIAQIPTVAVSDIDADWTVSQPVDAAHVFISYSRDNLQAVNRLNTDLLNAGLHVWFDQIGLKAGSLDWEQDLRTAIAKARAILFMASPSARQSLYVRDELAIARASGKRIYPVWVAGEEWTDSVPMGIGYTQFIDVRGEKYADGVQKIIAALSGEVVKLDTQETEAIAEPEEPQVPVDESQPPRNPYKGLRAFRAEDRRDFFGRDDLIQELVAALRDGTEPPRFLGVVGASGSGKSSMVMAGLLPALQNGAIPGSENWLYLQPFVPGDQPIENLTTVLRNFLPQMPFDTIQADLNSPTTKGLHRLAQQILKQPAQRLVLYIDQFEELFTLTASEDERQQFIDVLTTAVDEPGGQVIVILSLRADFYDRPLQYPQLGDLLKQHKVEVLPLSLADLYDVVQKPAALPDVQLQFEQGLETELVFAVREQVGALPLLQFTLDQLFEKREDRTLTWAAYEDIGGVKGALAQQADKTYVTLPSDQHRQLARTLFLRLIEPGATEQDTTRRRATYNQLTLTDTQQTRILQETANVFVDARLLVTDQSGDERTLEVSHEALIREWERLGEWLHDAHDDVRLQRALSADVTEWNRRGQPADMLYRGTVLADALAWSKRETPSRDEMLFLNASVEAEAAQKRRDEAIARRVQNFQRASVVLVIVALIAGIVSVLAFVQQRQANQREQAAVAAQETSVAHEQDANTQVFIAGAILTPIPATMAAVATQQDQSYRFQMAGRGALEQAQNENDALAFAFEAIGNAQPPLDVYPIFYDIAGHSHNRATLSGHSGYVLSVAFSPDGTLLASASYQEIKLWEVASGALLTTLSGHSADVLSVAFSPDGTLLASASRDNTIKLWNIASLPLMRQWVQENRTIRDFTCDERERFNMPVQCDDEGNYPTRTPYPTPSPIALPEWTPFWTAQPTATITPVPTLAFTPFYLNPTRIAEASFTPTFTPTPTITPTLTPTLAPVDAGNAQLGENRGEITVSSGQIWQYAGQAGDNINIRLSSDEFDTYLYVYDMDGNLLAENDDFDETNSGLVDFQMPDGGEIIIEVRSYQDSEGGVYTLVIEPFAEASATPSRTPTATATP